METHVPTVVLLVQDDVVAKHVDAALELAVPTAVMHRVTGPADAFRPLRGADLVVSDGQVPGWEGLAGFHHIRQGSPGVTCALLDDFDLRAGSDRDEAGLLALGVVRVAGEPGEIAGRVAELLLARLDELNEPDRAGPGADLLVGIVQQLSLAPDLTSIMEIVRIAARRLSGADGATFVLRDRGFCYYADEDAIGPLWKGMRFPLESCVSGWAMTRRQPAVIADVFADPRVPTEAYEPTFVRSMVMVPIRGLDPIGAIGTYWAAPRQFDPAEVRLLQTLADSTAVAIENVRVQANLERRVRERTEDLEAFTYAVSHDLRAPIRHISGFASMATNALAGAEPDLEAARTAAGRVATSAGNMREMVNGLLELSRIGRTEVRRVRVDLADLAREVALECAQDFEHGVGFTAPQHLWAECDPTLVRLVLQNLIGNAYKFTAGTPAAVVEFGLDDGADGPPRCFFVRDNGAGFNPNQTDRLFGVFQRLHDQREFPGTGIGLASVRRIVQRHGGEVSAEGRLDQGARFGFTLVPPELAEDLPVSAPAPQPSEPAAPARHRWRPGPSPSGR